MGLRAWLPSWGEGGRRKEGRRVDATECTLRKRGQPRDRGEMN